MILYPTPYKAKTTILPLKKKKWLKIIRDILRREGKEKEKVRVFLEPGKFFLQRENVTIYNYIKRYLKLTYNAEYVTLGLHKFRYATFDITDIFNETIHVAVDRPKPEVMDTIVHEIAHALVPHAQHNDTWKKEYRRLRDKYVTVQTVTSDNDRGMMEKLG